jgi:hypothetical protein
MFDTLSELFRLFETEEYLIKGKTYLESMRANISSQHDLWCREVKDCMS